MKFFRHFVLVLLAIGIGGCGGVGGDLKIRESGGANPWTNLEFYNEGDNFQFAIMSDRNGGCREGVFANGVEKVNLLKPEFVMCVGDLINGGTEDEGELDRQWDEFDGIVSKLEMPFFYVVGNHDIGNAVMARKWRERLGASYYHFVYRDVLFLCLNTEDGVRRNISDGQVEYFRDAIQANKDVRWTLLFMHQPVWKGEGLENWEELESLLGDREYSVFAGHKHSYQMEVLKGQRYYILSTTGAAGGDDDPADCQFDHIVWVTMSDEGPAMANLLLKGIMDDEPCGQ